MERQWGAVQAGADGRATATPMDGDPGGDDKLLEAWLTRVLGDLCRWLFGRSSRASWCNAGGVQKRWKCSSPETVTGDKPMKFCGYEMVKVNCGYLAPSGLPDQGPEEAPGMWCGTHGLNMQKPYSRNDELARQVAINNVETFADPSHALEHDMCGRFPFSWASGRQPFITTSTAESELVSCGEGFQCGESLATLLDVMGKQREQNSELGPQKRFAPVYQRHWELEGKTPEDPLCTALIGLRRWGVRVGCKTHERVGPASRWCNKAAPRAEDGELHQVALCGGLGGPTASWRGTESRGGADCQASHGGGCTGGDAWSSVPTSRTYIAWLLLDVGFEKEEGKGKWNFPTMAS